MKTKLLIATTDEKGLIFANIDTSRKYFSVCFDEVNAIEVDDDYLRERLENSLDGYDKESLYDLCETYNCAPSELADRMYVNLTVEEIIDISLFYDDFRVDGIENDIYFESVSCGQHDTRAYAIPIDKYIFDLIHNAWDTWHLKSLEEVNQDKLESFIDKVHEYEQKFDETEFIQEKLNEWYK